MQHFFDLGHLANEVFENQAFDDAEDVNEEVITTSEDTGRSNSINDVIVTIEETKLDDSPKVKASLNEK